MPFNTVEKRRKYQKTIRSSRRQEFFKDKVCNECGGKKNLLLHHIDPKTKIDSCIWSWGETKRLMEIQKCIVMCKSCHTKIHNSPGKPKEKGSPGRQRNPLQHGTLSAYRTYKCRCPICVHAESKRVMSYRMRQSI